MIKPVVVLSLVCSSVLTAVSLFTVDGLKIKAILDSERVAEQFNFQTPSIDCIEKKSQIAQYTTFEICSRERMDGSYTGRSYVLDVIVVNLSQEALEPHFVVYEVGAWRHPK